MTRFRLQSGGRIDRSRTLRFTFDGRALEGCEGDTLASALLANGIHLVGRSFKYHRPRGILSAGSDEPNALVAVGGTPSRHTPNLRATQVELFDGLVATSQNRFPSLAFDLGAVNDLFWRMFPAGFYYKTFLWPRTGWKRLYEPVIRAAAGLGTPATEPDPDRYAQRYAHCDVLVVGAGPAGIAAATAAAAAGARVILCDEQAELGGSLLAAPGTAVEGLDATDWLTRRLATLAASPGVTLLPRTTAFGYFPHNMIGLAQRLTDHLPSSDPALPRERLWQVRARRVVLATGAIERPMVFPGNDRPGVMLADAARTYAGRYGVKPGNRAVIVTAHDGAYRTALELASAGVEIAVVADLRPTLSAAAEAASRGGIEVRPATTICATSGRLRVSSADLAPVAADGTVGARLQIACDLVLMCGGFTPTIHLFSQSRGRSRYEPAVQAFIPDGSAEAEVSVGAARGVMDLADALADGAAAGVGRTTGLTIATSSPVNGFIGAMPQDRPASTVRAFVDFQNDVTAKDIGLAVQEGFRSIEHIKRYTTTGMATDQGKTSNLNALGIAAAALGTDVPQIGHTTFRNPFTPVTFGTLAGEARGDLFDPVRTTPIHTRAAALGAVFEDVGLWKRPRYFPHDGETMHQAVQRECAAVRKSVGMFDASTLGKIEIVGPDAAEFMNRMYVNPWTKLEPGRCRYGLMLREDGFIMDDGVVGRLAPDRFHVTTTTGGAAAVLNHMEDYLQTEWPSLDVWLTSTSEQWAVIAVQGPQARAVLEPLIADIDVSAGSMPHMSVRDGHLDGVPVRLFRVSFTGELGFEINVPASCAAAVWDRVWQAGAAYGIVPYGTEAMHVLRAEKGYIIIGQETDGTVTPDDVGLSWAIGKTKRDFVGKRSLARPAMAQPDRKQLVGLLTRDPGAVLPEGGQVVAATARTVSLGHVTSAYMSTELNRSIALAMVSGGRARQGETLLVPDGDRDQEVEIVSPVFVDPQGGRLNV